MSDLDSNANSGGKINVGIVTHNITGAKGISIEIVVDESKDGYTAVIDNPDGAVGFASMVVEVAERIWPGCLDKYINSGPFSGFSGNNIAH